MNNKEDFDLLLDNNLISNNDSLDEEQSIIHQELSAYKDSKLSSDFSQNILNKISYQKRVRLALVLQIAAFAMIALSLSLLMFQMEPKKNNFIIDEINNSLTQNNKIQNKKYYGIFFSSTLCKPCVEFLNEINDFKFNHQNKNYEFDIIFIETTPKSFQKQIKNNLATIDFKSIKNKKIFNELREGHGPAFVVLDNNGKVVTKHLKNKGRQNFKTVLTTFDKLIN